jgi:predicted transposase/invertase (TIGR01784 family)
VVGLLNFVLDEADGSGDVITRVSLKDERNRVFSKNLQFIFVEMPKFGKRVDELDTFLDKWLYVIQNMNRLNDKPAALTESIFHKLFDVAEIAQFSKVDRAEYEESLKVFWDFSNVLSSAERKGREEGIAEGVAKGEREEKLRNAKSFKDLGVDVEKISKATGLTKEEIERL